MDQTVSVDVSPRGSVSSNLFTVVKLDVTVGGVAEADEETAGAFVPYEADTNGTLSVRGIAALKPVAIECSPDDLPDSETVTVAAPAESLFEKIGDQYVPAQSEYKACEIGDKQFFLHGHAASGALRDLKVEVTHANCGAKDKAKFTVIKIVSIEPDPSAFIENYYQGSPLDSPANRVYTIPVSPSVIGNGTDPAGFVWPLHVNVRAVVEPAVPENELPESCGLVGGLNIPPNKLLHWVDLRAPKKDVFTFLNCGVDSGLKTTVYVFDARIKPFVDEGDRCIINVGHSWGQYWLNDPSLALIGSPAYLLVSRDVGFFPAPGDWTNKIWGDGVIRLDGAAGSDDHPITGHGNYRAVSFKKFRQALHLVYAKLPPNSPHYGLFDYNCTDFAIDLGLWVDVTTMSPSGTSTPWDFSDWLRVCPGL
ncbi:MAG: hypothetical protein PHX41_02385 [Kiritimatiellae bacterium]|nr:hypothetical protein [Kiritimatiellia bacterium]